MKKGKVLAVLLVVLFTFTACDSSKKVLELDTMDTNTIQLNVDGTVTSLVVEDFDQEYYNKEELDAFVKELEASYNEKAGAEIVKIKDFKVKDQTARLLLSYQDLSSYTQVEDMDIKLLTTEEALAEGTLPASYQQMGKDKEAVDKATALSEKENKVLILNNGINGMLPGKIKYYANGILLNDFTIQAEKDKTCVVIFKEKK